MALIILLLVITLDESINAQNSNLTFEQFNVEQGLSSSDITCIFQDKTGYLWFGSYGAIDRFDGYNFISYKHDPRNKNSIDNAFISKIYEDKKGNLWIGTSLGLDKLDRNSGSFTHFKPQLLSKNEWSNYVFSIYEDKLGILWIGTGSGLNIFDRNTQKFTTFLYDSSDPGSLSHNSIGPICEDKSGTLWIGTGGGLDKLDRKTNKFIHVWQNPDNKNGFIENWSTSEYWITVIYEDDSGTLWLGTMNGLVEINEKTKTLNHYKRNVNENLFTYLHSSNVVNSICKNTPNSLWVVIGNQLTTFDKKLKRFIRYQSNLNNEPIADIFRERSGTIWVSTNNGGINKLKNTEQPFIKYSHKADDPASLISDQIIYMWENPFTGLGVSKGNLWVFTSLGLCFFDPESEKFSQNFKFRNLLDKVSIILYNPADDVWFVGTQGIFKLTNNGKIISINDSNGKRFSQGLWSVCYTQNNGIWLSSTEGGIFALDTISNSFKQIYKSNLTAPTLYYDSSGNVWAGLREGGLLCFNLKNNSMREFKSNPADTSTLSGNIVWSFCEDDFENLWVGTNNGLSRYNPENGKFTNFYQNKPVLTILKDDDKYLWISTDKDISRFSPSTGQFKNYDVFNESKIVFNFGTGCKTENGELYFGGKGGFIRFNPKNIEDNTFIPPIVITSFKKFEIPYPFGKRIELNYTENFLSFEFAALSYISPEKNQYAYKMEGVDTGWVYSGTRRFASYPNLDPGEYDFRVKGSNNDGVWNEEGTSIAIIISPPLWKTWWAYSLYAGIFILVLYWIRRYEMNRISYKNQTKIDRAVLIEKEATEKIKSDFFANISHEFRTPLTLILGPAEKIEKNESTNPAKDAGIITRNSRRLLQLVNQLLDLSKLDAGKLKLEASPANIVSFVKGLALSFESLSESKDVMIKIKSDKEFIEVYFDREKMFKTFSNLLSNAFKFTPQRGNVIVAISEIPNNKVEIKIRNTGIGIPRKELPKLFDRFYQVDSSQTKEYEGTGIGLALVKELIELHHGSITVDSEIGDSGKTGWTEFTINLPLGREHLNDDEILSADKEIVQKETPVDEAEYVSPRTLVATETIQDETKTTILVVEDNYDMREYIKESLSDTYAIEEAVNGEQGIRIAENIIPDLIISDLMMPKLDGNELTRILKNDERTSHIPIIILTAKSGQENKIVGLKTGADDYLTKPFDLLELRVRVENLINIRKKLQEKFSKGEFLSKRIDKKLKNIDEKFLAKVLEVIEKHLSEEEFSIEECSNEVGFSRTHFHKKLRALVGKSPSQYVRTVRLYRAKQMIEEEKGNVSEVAYSVGFSSPAYFSKCFKEEFGYPPSDILS